jgi:hypothetical protein
MVNKSLEGFSVAQKDIGWMSSTATDLRIYIAVQTGDRWDIREGDRFIASIERRGPGVQYIKIKKVTVPEGKRVKGVGTVYRKGNKLRFNIPGTFHRTQRFDLTKVIIELLATGIPEILAQTPKYFELHEGPYGRRRAPTSATV